ncbi:glycosyltransferase [Paenibacillus farraposensis]|uniref:Glycosyltransferase n=1 Tax=Paenibacillus farraposensis TaxID=2807095 RepID=A0ABW4DCB3_9BACL|nr:glycosyltransferase [Paenibacillus farraposensis]
MNRSIAFVIHNLVLYETIKPLIKECEKKQIVCDIYVPQIEEDDWGDMALDTYHYLKSNGINATLTNSVPDKVYKLAFYPYLPYYLEVKSDYKFRYQYGMAKPNWNLDSWSRNFDFIFCNGLYDSSVLAAYTQTEIVGMIKYANFQRKKHETNKYNLLYLPTYGNESSIELVMNHIEAISDAFNIKVKLHHGTSFLEHDRVHLVKSRIPDVLDHKASLVSLIEEADVILSDGSGAIFDALFTDTPIVIFQHPQAESFEGILPLEEQIVQNSIVPFVNADGNIKQTLLDAILDKQLVQQRRKFTLEMFPVKGRETIDKCMEVINRFLKDDVDHAYRAGHTRLKNEFNELQAHNQAQKQEIEQQKQRIIEHMDQINTLVQTRDQQEQVISTMSADFTSLSEEKDILEQKYARLMQDYKDGMNSLDILNHQYKQLFSQHNEFAIQFNELKEYNSRLSTELHNIYNSKRWKMANKLKHILHKSKMIYVLKGYKVWKSYGTTILLKKIKAKVSLKLKNSKATDQPIDLWKDAEHTKSLLTWYEYRFLNYKLAKDNSFSLELDRFKIQFEKNLVSVILPVYNGEDYVAKAIDSILRQTYKYFELIIINDGSKDGTAEIIDEYARADHRISVVHQENRKIPRTLSRGFKLANGEFYTWTSADNILPENFLEKMVADLKQDENIGMIFANMRLIDSNDQVISNHGWYEEPQFSGNVMLPKSALELNVYPNNTIGAAFMYRAKVARLLGDYSSYKHTLEDYDYWMRVNSLFELKHVTFDEPIYDYRWHDKSLTAADQELGITSNRYKLMVLDDYRRDFYLTPLVWIIEGDAAEVEKFTQYVLDKGHTVAGREEVSTIIGLNLATPVCYLYIRTGDVHDFEFIEAKASSSVYTLLMDKSEHPADTFVADYPWDLKIKDKMNGETDNDYDFFVQDTDVLFSLINTKIKNDHLYRIEAVIESEPVYNKRLSVIICTYQRSEKLSNAIKSVIEQSLNKTDYEIIVVNNDYLNDEIHHLVREFRTTYNIDESFLRYMEAPLKGLSFARNVGLFGAEGEVLLYIDDDAIASPDLLEETVKGFSTRPDIGVMGGNIILNLHDERPDVVKPGTEAFWSQLIVEGEGITDSNYQWEFPYGANFAVRHAALMRIGGFRSAYGRKGNNYAGGEEIVVSFAMREIGYKVGLNPRMKVIHDVDASRYTVEHVRKTMRNSILTNYQLQKDLYAPMESDIEADKNHLEIVKAELNHLQKLPTRNRDVEIDILYKQYTIEAYEELIQLKENDMKLRKKFVEAYR